MVMECVNSSLAKSFWQDEDFRNIEYNDNEYNYILEHMGPNHLPTSLKADLCQDINRVSSFRGALMEHFLEGIAPLRHH